MERNRTVIQRSIEGLIKAYQLSLSPLLPPSCRFYPSCSEYAIQAVRIHGALRGSALAAKRLCRCHPWNEGGYDPVPDSQAYSPDLQN